MKTKLLFYVFVLCLFCILYYGFTPSDDSPRWNFDPRTHMGLSPEGAYRELPQTELYVPSSNEPRYTVTPQGTFAVGPNFRVHPRAAGTQSETPITRHPLNPNILFASANTFQGGGFSTGVFVTTNGGVNWFGNDTLGGTILNFGDPGPMIDHTGRFLISYITSAGGMGASYSINNGATFSSTFTFGSSANGPDKNLSATDDDPTSAFYGRSYTVWTEFSGAFTNRIVVSYTADQGVSWSARAVVSPPPSAGHHHQGCDIAVRPDGGGVYVVWANCTTNGQNSTEDSLGFAKSSDGGVTWSSATNHAVNTNGIRTSDLLTPSTAVIRSNGFPRIAVDKTNGPNRNTVYVVMAEKSFAPAVGVADIVLMKSVDLGITYTRTKVNQNTNVAYEYCPAINVDETGAVNICYYSTRNVPTNDSAEIYLSRSTDAGATFTDVKISDHKFRPAQISGTAGGYQGDYIGITSGGAGKIFPYWCEGSTASSGRYQAWTSLVDITKSGICEDFLGTNFNPTDNFYEEYTGTNYWSRQTPTAYGIGTSGSARFNSWSASAGTIQSLTSYQFTAAPANTYITFDHAYAPWSTGFTNIDSLIIETSADGGTSYSILQRLWGGLNANAGPLNTVFVGGGQFTPTNSQWAPKIFLLPVGTNKIKFRGRSGNGNDIWVDNICVQTLAVPSGSANVGVFPQGFYRTPPPQTIRDTVRIYLHRIDFPNIKIDSAISYLSTSFVASSPYTRALTGTYYIVVKHRNSIETWSKSGGQPYTRGSSLAFNFTNPANQAFNNNQALVNPFPYYGMYGGDVNRDHAVDLADLANIENAATNFASGYVIQDLTGDNFVDINDQAIADNNVFSIVLRQAPPGAEPKPQPFVESDSKNLTNENKSGNKVR